MASSPCVFASRGRDALPSQCGSRSELNLGRPQGLLLEVLCRCMKQLQARACWHKNIPDGMPLWKMFLVSCGFIGKFNSFVSTHPKTRDPFQNGNFVSVVKFFVNLAVKNNYKGHKGQHVAWRK